VADIMGLSMAFWWLALLIALIPLTAYLVVKH
jgi:hypothetical protein